MLQQGYAIRRPSDSTPEVALVYVKGSGVGGSMGVGNFISQESGVVEIYLSSKASEPL